MEVKQIKDMINTWAEERCGDARFSEEQTAQFIVNEDLSNIVDVGTQIVKAGWKDNFQQDMIDRIGIYVFTARRVRSYRHDILRKDSEYGSILAKCRVKRFAASDNPTWGLQRGDTPDQFMFNPPTTRTTFFNDKLAWEIDCSFPTVQLDSALINRYELQAWFDMIETTISQGIDDQIADLIDRGVNGFIGEHLNAGRGVVDLLAGYTTATGDTTLTQNTMFTSEAFNKYCAYQYLLYKDRLRKKTSIFNMSTEAGYDTATPPELLHFYLHSDGAKALDVYLQSEVYHNEFTEIGNYESIPAWQSSGSSFEFALTSRIDIKVPSDNSVTINRNGILGLMFDHDAIMMINQNRRVTSAVNARGEFYNNFYKLDSHIITDLWENGIVFVAGTGTP
jgi:hypothetical protein